MGLFICTLILVTNKVSLKALLGSFQENCCHFFFNTHLIVGLKRLLCENIYLATPEMKFKTLAPCVIN